MDTSIVSNSLSSVLVKIPLIGSNLPLTKVLSSRVGNSEAIRLLSTTRAPDLEKKKIRGGGCGNWNEWLGGQIDGDGCFLLSKKGYTSLEITMSQLDQHCLNQIKQKYGGSVKLRSGVKAVRYRLHHKTGLLALIADINGHIRNPIRFAQLFRICGPLNITPIDPLPITIKNGWFVGFWDAQGTITYNSGNNYQQSISASNKYPEILYPFKESLGGNVYPDRGKYPSYKWSISSKDSILLYLEYTKNFPSRSAKRDRLFLIPEYYKLISLNAHKEPQDSILGKSWKYFLDKWNRYHG